MHTFIYLISLYFFDNKTLVLFACRKRLNVVKT